ncbi:NAD(P)H-hydrate dehydratase [uncultured Dokdonia sp.]|uniref:NAD(P)H-hydrate dehydratase n=1 Tax=uncultured Dokdonia sp. TaxID=575653 RepID=UPI002620B8EC|nr:NAD(P)H-hydrate dehydratase [uncultured Dokdonia sp.]
MKIYSRKQIYEAHKITAEKEKLPSINLMERAGGYMYEWVNERLKGGKVPIKVFCGIGKNGGDGMVLARYLIENNYNVTTYIVNYNTKRVPDFLEAYSRLKSATKNWPIVLKEGDELPEISPQDIVIDAIFGIGLNRAAQDWVKKLFAAINDSKAYVLSVDIPSGMYMDLSPQEGDVIVRPRFTLSYQAPKLPFFLPATAPIMQAWDILNIGLDPEYLITTPTDVELIGKQEVIKMYRSRDQFSHKGMFGHSVLIGGSYGKMGAIVLSSKAAMRAGSGMVTAYVPQLGVPILQTAIPEVMTETDNFNGKVLEEIDFQTEANAIGIGPGMGTDPKTAKAVEAFLKGQKTPMIIDADAINIIAANPTLLEHVPNLSIFTPHLGELERLIGTWKDDFDRLKKTAEFAKNHDIIIVMKGAHTIVTYDMKLYINDSGNPGLATAGSGDVLTGVITGLLAQSYHPMEAALMGVYFHGRAADIAINQYGIEGLIASDVTEFLGRAYMDLFAKPEEPKAP